ncbi:MAG: hypothetical protein H7249_04850 [Chitinophagaceae bacterium]|nr:hypothetical protein [Oligoflexus sp.]
MRNRSTRFKSMVCGLSLMAIGFSPVLWIHVPSAFAAESLVKIGFKKNAFEIGPAQESLVTAGAEKAQNNPKLLIFIHNHVGALPRNSLAYLAGQVRSLKIFQALVSKGINPERIYLQADSSKDGPTEDVSIEYSEGDIGSIPKLSAVGGRRSGPATFVLPFIKAEEFGSYNETALRTFLSGFGQKGHETLQVEGGTSFAGTKALDEVSAELRVLTAYEMIIRRGFPYDHIFTKVSAAVKGRDAFARRVTLKWSKSTTNIAKVLPSKTKTINRETPPSKEVAAQIPMTPASEVEPAPEPVAVSSQAPATTPAIPSEPSSSSSVLDLVLFAGALMPGGDLKDHTKAGTEWGLGLGKSLWSSPYQDIRLNLLVSGKTTLRSKESALSGPLAMQYDDLRLDYVLGNWHVRPFLGLGGGVYIWNVSVTDVATGVQHSKRTKDAGSLLTFGLDCVLGENVFLTPAISWHKIAGNFAESLISGDLSLRWRL